MKYVCVFLGAKEGSSSVFTNAVQDVGKFLAENKLGLVYGGASIGLMGILANKALSCGGEVIGVMPETLMAQEIDHKSLTKLYTVPTIQERKKLMVELSDAFVVFPGGIGTVEEFFEVWNAIKIGQINKPLGVLNIDGYYDGLLCFMDNAVKCGFVTHAQRDLVSVSSDPLELVNNIIALLPVAEETVGVEMVSPSI